MAIVINKKYDNYTPASVLIEDMQAACEWSAIEEDTEKQSTKFYINPNTYIEIFEASGYSEKTHKAGAPTMQIHFKGRLIYTMGGLMDSNNQAAFSYIVRTNKATIFQYGYNINTYYEAGLNTTMFIISSATDYIRGDDGPVLTVIESPGASTSGAYNLSVVFGDDVASDSFTKVSMPGTLGKNKTILLPMFFDGSTYILDHVYLMYQSQLTGMHRGECKLNGRDYYVCNFIITPDE